MKEIYKILPNEPDYEVSNKGNMRTRAYKKIYDDDGFTIEFPSENIAYGVTDRKLVCHINGKTYYIHRLVAELFLDNPNHYRYVRHIDGNYFNNSVENLEWSAHSASKQAVMERQTGYPILCIETGEQFRSIRDCSSKLGLDYYKLRKAILDKTEIDGYTFQFN